ncbi:MAG: zinc metallopeptidase [Planctomycetaceae bacterium]|nr:zinc metallopeptidase [Planctomycetaceae bacterium]
MGYFFDIRFILFVTLPGLVMSGLASLMVKSAFAKYSQVRTRRGYTGAQAARILLDQFGLHNVGIEQATGFLSDHYNPATRTLALSPDVYNSPSIAAVGVACHEAGHAIQHAQHYVPLWARSALVPLVGIGAHFSELLLFLGIIMSAKPLLMLGVIAFGSVVLFQLVTLPVEFDASARAKRLCVEYGIVTPDEQEGVNKVLNAAALTYVAAFVTSLLTLLYYLIRFGLLNGRRDDE